MKTLLFIIFITWIGHGVLGAASTEVMPEKIEEILSNYCVDCHDEATQKGDLNLDFFQIDWTLEKNRMLWEKVHQANTQSLMPPVNKKQPTAEERKTLTEWLDSKLLEHTPLGSTLPRRLNQAEYQATIRKLFLISDFELPQGFPSDTEFHGFPDSVNKN